MNLMFWKKKKPDSEEAMDEDSGKGASSADMRAEDADPEAQEPHATGVKSWFTSIAQNLKSGRAPETEEDQAEAEASSHAGSKAKTKAAPRDAHEHDAGDEGSADGIWAACAELAQDMKERFAAFTQRFRKSASQEEVEAEEAGGEHREETESEDESEDAVASRRKHKRRLLLIAAASTLSLLLLAGIGFVVWKVLFTRPVQQSATSGTIESSRESKPQASIPSASAPPPEVDSLRKRNEELQMQLDVLKSERSSEPTSVAISYGANGSAVSATSQGDLALGTGDPQAAAKGLKEAIEAMNATTGDAKGAPRK